MTLYENLASTIEYLNTKIPNNDSSVPYLVSHTGTPLLPQHQHPVYMWYQLHYHGPDHSTSRFYHIRYNYQDFFPVLVELACWCNTLSNSRCHLSDAIPWLGYRLDIKHE